MGDAVCAHSDHVRPENWCSVCRRRSAAQSLRCCVVNPATPVAISKESPNEETNGVGFSYPPFTFSNSEFSQRSGVTKSGALLSRAGISHDQRQASYALQFRRAKQKRISRRPLCRVAQSAALREKRAGRADVGRLLRSNRQTFEWLLRAREIG